jgi:type IV fimbrial biogenesis protein FimT
MEVIVIVSIIGILSAIVIPNMIGWRAQRQLQGTARVLYGDLQQARMTAIREAETVSVVFDFPTGDYQIFMDSNQDYVLDADETELKDVTTIDQVTVQSITLPGNRSQFNARGMSAEVGNVVLTNSRNDRVTISLNSLGRITIQ